MRRALTDRLKNFEDLKHIDADGSEYWTARELLAHFGYDTWENFHKAIKRAQQSVTTSGINTKLVFREVTNYYETRNRYKTFKREQIDYEISRYGCYILAQNGDPTKDAIAGAQAYFAIQTRKLEVQEQFEELDSDAQRLLLRNEVIDNNKRLNSSAKQHGVMDYGRFHNEGYKGLYGGKGIRQIERHKKLGKDKLLDRADTTELAANLFRITQTENVLSNDAADGIRRGQQGAENIHREIGKRVRQTMIENKSTLPENLPPAREHIKQLERRMKRDDKALPQPAEKPLKLTNPKGFEDTLGIIERHRSEEKAA